MRRADCAAVFFLIHSPVSGHEGTSPQTGAPKAPRRSAPRPSSLISFTEPEPTGDDHVVRVVFDDREDWPAPLRRAADQPRRWGFYPSHATAGDEVPDDVEYRFNTVEAATIGALQYLEPYWNDDSSLAIHNGVRVPDMPSNAVVTGSPGYRARIDAGLYDMDLEQLQAVHLQTERQNDAQASRPPSATRFRSVSWSTPSA